jgi:hypothetical protein
MCAEYNNSAFLFLKFVGRLSRFLRQNVESLGRLDVIYLKAKRIAPTIGMEHALYTLSD